MLAAVCLDGPSDHYSRTFLGVPTGRNGLGWLTVAFPPKIASSVRAYLASLPDAEGDTFEPVALPDGRIMFEDVCWMYAHPDTLTP